MLVLCFGYVRSQPVTKEEVLLLPTAYDDFPVVVLLTSAKIQNDTLEFRTSYDDRGNCRKYQFDLKKKTLALSYFNEKFGMGYDSPHTIFYTDLKMRTDADQDKSYGKGNGERYGGNGKSAEQNCVEAVLAYLKKKGVKP